jgi:hypothetical protein
MSANDEAWKRYFEATDALGQIEHHGYCCVMATDLKRLGKREPRLMAKLDTMAERPRILKEYDLALFPIRNGEYILFRDPDSRSYFRIPDAFYETEVESYGSVVDLSIFDSFPGSLRLNESQAIDFAYISSLLRHFTGDRDIHLAIRGRLFSDSFGFRLPLIDHEVKVSGVQIEVDAGYESPTAIYLIEAKVGRREDFHIRQLYYPYLNWSVKSQKRVVPIFLTHTNGKYHLTEFRFGEEFGDVSPVKSRCFVIDESPIPRLNTTEYPSARVTEDHESSPFPQADDLDKILDLLAAFDQGADTKMHIAQWFEFDERQGDYYANAAVYIGLAARRDHRFEITDLGRRFLACRSRGQRTEMLFEQLMARPVFRETLRLLQQREFNLDEVSTDEVSTILARFTPLSRSTLRRRAQTVKSWMRWILANSQLIS